MRYFLGADLGATKTHTLITDETGVALGFGESGPGNHESIGYDLMFDSMRDGMEQALNGAGLKKADITGAGFGVAGYDWLSEYEATEAVIRRLGLSAPYKFVNDTVPGLIAGSEEGWGVVIVSGTGSNCRGWDREHKREGRVTGHGVTWHQAAKFAVAEICGRHDDARVGEVRRLQCHIERDGAVRLTTELAISVKFLPVQGATA